MAAEEHLSDKQFMYHGTDPKNRESISAHGLRPRTPAEHDIWTGLRLPKGVYLSANKDMTLGKDKWRVDVTDLPLHDDPDDSVEHEGAEKRGWKFSQEHIPPHRLTHLGVDE